MPLKLKACRDAWTPVADLTQTAVHSDLNSSNLLKTARGEVALLDWDEARLDAPLFDTALLSRNTLDARDRRLLTAWEVAVSWHVEPEHARRQARRLLTGR